MLYTINNFDPSSTNATPIKAYINISTRLVFSTFDESIGKILLNMSDIKRTIKQDKIPYINSFTSIDAGSLFRSFLLTYVPMINTGNIAKANKTYPIICYFLLSYILIISYFFIFICFF